MKKTVKILLMEPKPLLLDLTKKAILTKPDQQYEFKIVGTALTAKAGYFELYKHKPNILFLDPEQSDEDGLSFIQHAIERLPHLKIVVLTSKMIDDEWLKAGARAVIHVPIQKANVWRKLDELTSELNQVGLLDDYEKEEEAMEKPTKGLFDFEDPSEKATFTPLFEDMMKPDTDESVLDGEPEEEIVEVIEPVTSKDDDTLVIDDDDEMVIFPFDNDNQESKEKGLDGAIVDDEEDSVGSHTEEESTFIVEADLFENITESETETESPYDKLSPELDRITQPDALVESENESLELNPYEWMLDLSSEEESKSEESVVEEPEAPVIYPVFDLEPHDIEVSDQESSPAPPPIFTFEDFNEKDDAPKLEISQPEEFEPHQLPQPVFEFPVEPQTQTLAIPVVERVETPSNTPNTENPLYFQTREYNKTTTKEKRSFEAGYFNRDNQFVPLYPPRDELLSKISNDDSTIESEKTTPPQEKSEEGLFSSVKKLFRRR